MSLLVVLRLILDADKEKVKVSGSRIEICECRFHERQFQQILADVGIGVSKIEGRVDKVW